MAQTDPRLLDIPSTVNEEIQDRAIRHAMFIERYKTGVQKRIIEALERSLTRVLDRLDARLARAAKLGIDPGPATTRRLQELGAAFDEIISKVSTDGYKQLTDDALELAAQEVEWQVGALKQALPIKLELALPAAPMLRAAVTSRPMSGRLLRQWFQDATAKSKKQFMEVVQAGIAEGLSFQQIVQAVRGTQFERIVGGVMKVFSDDHGALVRSAITHASTQAREALFRENEDLIDGVQWISTLDTITCPTCQALDGRVFDIGKGPRPPRHLNCRCTTAPVTKSWRALGLDLEEAPPGTRASMNGQVPSKLTYNQWIKRQPADIQDLAEGPTRGALLRTGKLAISQFVAGSGQIRTLKELAALEPEAFKAANLLDAPALKAQLSAAQRAQAEAKVAIEEARKKLAALKAGEGLQLELQALNTLETTGGLRGLAQERQLAKIMEVKDQLQAKKTQAGLLSKAKTKLIAGEKLTPAQEQAVLALDGESAEAFKASIFEGQAKLKAIDDWKALVKFDPDEGLSFTEFAKLRADLGLQKIDIAKVPNPAETLAAHKGVFEAEKKALAEFNKLTAKTGQDDTLLQAWHNAAASSDWPDMLPSARLKAFQDQIVVVQEAKLAAQAAAQAEAVQDFKKAVKTKPEGLSTVQHDVIVEKLGLKTVKPEETQNFPAWWAAKKQTLHEAQLGQKELNDLIAKAPGDDDLTQAILNSGKKEGFSQKLPQFQLGQIEVEYADIKAAKAAAAEAADQQAVKDWHMFLTDPDAKEIAQKMNLPPSIEMADNPQLALGVYKTQVEAEIKALKTFDAMFKSPDKFKAANAAMTGNLDALPSEWLAKAQDIVEKELTKQAVLPSATQAQIEAAGEKLAKIKAKAKGTYYPNFVYEKMAKAGELEGLNDYQILKKVEAEAELVKAKSQQATKLAAAKKKLAAGKAPSATEQAAIDKLTASEKETFDQAVAKLKGDAEAVVVGQQRRAARSTEALVGDDLERVGEKPGGSVPGFTARHKGTGERWIVKETVSEDISRNEALAAELYRLAGVEVPEIRLVNFSDGRVGVASKILPDVKPLSGTQMAASGPVRQGFAVDAWLANWDVVGLEYDNMILTGGRAVRIDVGGALRYRAMGGMKGSAWGRTVDELDSLRNPGVNREAASVFGKIPEADLEAGVKRVLAVTDEAIDEAVDRLGPVGAAEKAELKAILKARRDDLGRRFPHLTAAKAAPDPEDIAKAVADVDIKTIEAGRSNGWARLTDKEMVEDNNVLFWQEGEVGGPVADRTGARLKLRKGGRKNPATELDRIAKELGGADSLGGVARGARPVNVVDEGGTVNQIITAIKGIATKGPTVRADDWTRVKLAREKYDDLIARLEQHIRKGELDRDIVIAYRDAVEPWLEAAERAVKDGIDSPMVWRPPAGTLKEFSFPRLRLAPKEAKALAPGDTDWKWATGHEEKVHRDGHLLRTGGNVQFSRVGRGDDWIGARYIERRIGGVRVRYWPNDSKVANALKGKIEFIADGTGQEATDQIMAAMRKLGVDAERATKDYLEERYLAQHYWARNDEIPQRVKLLKNPADRIKEMQRDLSAKAGYDITRSPHYNYLGRDNGFGHMVRQFYRADLDGDFIEQTAKDYVFSHSTSGNPRELFMTLFDQGGYFNSKFDFFRRGADFSKIGMSPEADMERGGGAYLYTTMATRSRPRGEFNWSARMVRRLDQRTHYGDPYGRINPGDRIPWSNDSYIRDRYYSSYETIFKNGASLFDDDFFLVVSRSDRDFLLDWLKTKGPPYSEGLWPDGRRLEEVIVLR